MRRLTIVLLLAVGAVAAPARAACPPPDYPPALLDFIRAQGFMLDDDAERDALALALLDCLGDPDPRWRDATAFGALATWLRTGALGDDTLRELQGRLVAQLGEARDPRGFRRPFVALVLAEVARADRVQPRLDDAQRAAMVAAAIAYLRELRDYRGFIPGEGWRHGVAHAADLVLQLVSSERIAAADVARLLDALATQVAPTVDMAYVHGEPERLARAAYWAWRRGVLDDAWWDAWVERVSAPAPLPSWQAAYAGTSGLARRHNVRAFVLSLAHLARRGGGEQGERLLAACDRALDRIDAN